MKIGVILLLVAGPFIVRGQAGDHGPGRRDFPARRPDSLLLGYSIRILVPDRMPCLVPSKVMDRMPAVRPMYRKRTTGCFG